MKSFPSLQAPLKGPHKVFSEVLDRHWRSKRPYIEAQLRAHSVPESQAEPVRGSTA